MGSFTRGDRVLRDFQLLFNSPVQKFWSPSNLEDTVSWLRTHGYRIIEFRSEEWRSEVDMHLAFEQLLSFPSYYGRNLDALDECLADFALYEFGSDPQATGTVLGHRMLCLVQTDDPRLEIEPVGSQPVIWNHREFLNTSRGV